MTPEPGGDRAARSAGRGHLRASHADREQVIERLKEAFVQGWLAKDEFDSRAGHALASRTHADLAALIADLPAGQPTAQPSRRPIRSRSANTTLKRGARVIAATTALTWVIWAGAVSSQADGQALGLLVWCVTFVWLGIVTLAGAVMLESRKQQRSGGQLPPASGPGGQSPGRMVFANQAGSLPPGHHDQPRAAKASRPRCLAPGRYQMAWRHVNTAW